MFIIVSFTHYSILFRVSVDMKHFLFEKGACSFEYFFAVKRLNSGQEESIIKCTRIMLYSKGK